MLISEETKEKINQLIRETFQMNSFCDNIAYNLDFSVYPHTSELFHLNVAHKFPEFADGLSDLMIRLNARPVRKGLDANEEDFNGDLSEIFNLVDSKFEEYRQKIIEAIEIAELNGDIEVKIALEELSMAFLPYRKQANIWKVEIERYNGDYKSFDYRIRSFTTVIPVMGGADNE